jgi:hypothetical protein
MHSNTNRSIALLNVDSDVENAVVDAIPFYQAADNAPRLVSTAFIATMAARKTCPEGIFIPHRSVTWQILT